MNRKAFLRSSLVALLGAGLARRGNAADKHWYNGHNFRFLDGQVVWVQTEVSAQQFEGTAPFQMSLWVQRQEDKRTGTYAVERVGPAIRKGQVVTATFRALSFSHEPVLAGKLPERFGAELEPGKLLRIELEKGRFADLKPSAGALEQGCFLTTACTHARGLPDDCAELQAMRHLRDAHLLRSAAGTAIVDEYYRIAPTMVQVIDNRTNSGEFWEHLYSELVQPTAKLVWAGELERAAQHYVGYVEALQDALVI